MLVEINQLKLALCDLLKKQEIPEEEASCVVDSLIEAELRGVHEQGVMRIKQLLSGLQNGTIRPKKSVQIIKANECVYCIDANHSIGPGIACEVMDLVISKSKVVGVAVGSVINASHIGSLHYYVKRAVDHKCIAIGCTVSSPAVCLPGGRDRVFGTNPIAYAIPARGTPVIADFSTSMVSRGKVLGKLAAGENVPADWIVNSAGKMSMNPQDLLEGGALLPFSKNHKASLISLLISVLAGPMIGGVNNFLVRGTRDMSKLPNKGDLFLVFHIPHFTSMEVFLNKMDELKKFMESVESSFHIPNTNSVEVYERNLMSGVIKIDKDIADMLNKGDMAHV